MRRRTFLHAASAALGTGIAGCLAGRVSTGNRSGTDADHTAAGTDADHTAAGTDADHTADGTEPSRVTVDLTVRNLDGRRRSGTVSIVHDATPACRYATPACGRPSTRTVALDAPFDLASGDGRRVGTATMEIHRDGDAVDAYAIEVDTDAGSGRLDGLAAGATATVGRDDAGASPWRVVAGRYRIRAVLGSDGVAWAWQSVP
ncbi:MAG: hypothetical protein ABEJ81_06265 [Haloferacaceae archaeon]